MLRLARRSIKHPRVAIAAWLVIALGLGLVGAQIEHRFAPTIIVPQGTESAEAEKLALDEFGNSQLTPILLVGPAGQLDKQGPRLAEKLRARSDVQVLSPWDGTPGSAALRPSKTEATIVASIRRPEKEVIETVLPAIERTVDRSVTSPVETHITGQASIDREMRDVTLDQTRSALAIAIPALLVVLLLVMRAPIAALVTGVFAVTILPVGYGLTAIAASIIRVDAIAVAGASMVGLALSALFGALVVTRFRDEYARAPGNVHATAGAAAEASATAGRAVLIAGTAVVVAMVLASALSMSEILNSIGIGATLMAIAVSVGALTVLPALLVVGGSRIESGAFWRGATERPLRRRAALPAAAAVAGLALLVALAAPVLSLGSEAPGAEMLPPGNEEREDYEAVASAMGPGWVSPMEVVVARSGHPVTTRTYLAKLHALEKKLAKDPAVHSVVGPGELLTNANELQGVPGGLNTAAKTAEESKKSLKKLIAGLRLATGGVAQLRGGLGEAADGAGRLQGGTGQAHSGSGQLSSGLAQANAGAEKLRDGAAAASAGAKDLAGGLKLAEHGVTGGIPAIDKLIAAVNSNSKEVGALEGGASATKGQIAAAAAELAAMQVGRDDPHYSAVVSGLERAAVQNDALAGAITTAAVNAQLNATTIVVVKQQIDDLQVGIRKLLAGGNELATGLGKLAGGQADLADGINQLDAGSAKLQDGLGQLYDGAGQLAAGLASGAGPSGELLAGMNTITSSVVKAREGIPSTKDLEKLRRDAPGLFDSGYFVLAAIDGAPEAAKEAASFVVNVDEGGNAGRITVVSNHDVGADSTLALHERLVDEAGKFAKATDSQVTVGGTASNLIEYRDLALERLPVVIAAIALLTFVLMAMVTRSVVVPVAAVVLNLLAAAAAFGVMALAFGGDDPPLGGPGFVDPVSIIAIVTIVLALAIDYEVFAVSGMRLITGASLAMLAVLVAFAPSDLILIRQFAIGMATAVVIEALVVRRLLVAFKRYSEQPRTPRIFHGPRPVHH